MAMRRETADTPSCSGSGARRAPAKRRPRAGTPARLAAPAIAAVLALAAAPAESWGPAGQWLQDVHVVTSIELLHALEKVHPPAAAMLAAFLPGREAPEAGISFGEWTFAGLPTPATAELDVRGVPDRTAHDASMRPLPSGAAGVVTRRFSNWTGTGDLDVTFVSDLVDAAGRKVVAAFPAVTVHVSAGDPAFVTGWHLSDAKEQEMPPDQGAPAPVTGQVNVRVPTTLEPLSAIKAYSQAMVRQDLDTMIALMHPLLVKTLGGPDQALAWMQQNLVRFRRFHAWPTAEQINDVRPLPAAGVDLYIVQSTRWFDGWPKPRGMSYVYLLETPDRGRHWEVIDLPRTGLRWLHALAPGFKDDPGVAGLLPDDTLQPTPAKARGPDTPTGIP
jgi:hypothetical protein